MLGSFPVPWPRTGASWRPAAHPCKVAHDALIEAGHDPDVVRVFSFGFLPDVTRRRREVKRLTGQSYVPVLVLGNGRIVCGSAEILRWASAAYHPQRRFSAASRVSPKAKRRLTRSHPPATGAVN